MKILSPAGNFECLKMAVFNGANEVYLGINNLNARNNIDGFTLDNLEQAVDFAHLYGVKVLLAINILFNNSEIQSALDTIVDAYNLGVDAFIIQDLGLAKLVHDNYPNIELHASTQMGIHNLEGVKYIEQFGFTRVVLARETPLSEIKRIKQNSDIEIEYFAQGALCVSFSGNCYLSSYLHGASGNRGKCKQLCRLPYTLSKDDQFIKSGYLLSAKDFCLIDTLNELKDAGVDVIKIEGRARRPYYVAMATSEYYKAINGKPYNHDNLRLAFNREYTNAYFDGNGNIITDYNNHIGITIGKVDKFVKGKKFNEIYFTSIRPLSPKSTLKFFDGKNEVGTISAYDLQNLGGTKYRVTTTQVVQVRNAVNLIVDAKHEEQTLNYVNKQNVDIQICAIVNNPIKAIVKLNNTTLQILGDICQPALKQPLTADDIYSTFAKHEYLQGNINILTLSNVFLTKSQLNTFRRKVFDTITNTITSEYKHNELKTKVSTNYLPIKVVDFEIIEDITSKIKSTNVIYSPSEYKLNDVIKLKTKCDEQNKTLYLDTPNFATAQDIQLLNDIINTTKVGIVANNYYALTFDTNIVIGAGLNVYNNYTASIYNLPLFSAEGSVGTKINFPYMTLRHCPFKSHMHANCNNCPYSKGYTYTMDSGKTLKLTRKKLSSCTFYLTD